MLFFRRSEGFAVAIVFAISVCLAIAGVIYLPAKVPAVSPRELAAITATPEITLQDTDRSSKNEQAGLVVQPPETLQLNPPDNLSVRPRSGSAPLGFRDLVWGSLATISMFQVGGPYGSQKRYIWRSKNKELTPVFGAPVAQESYLFQDGKLCGGEMLFDGFDSFQKIKDGITKLFGPPGFADEANHLFKWNWRSPDVELRISYRQISRQSTLHLERK